MNTVELNSTFRRLPAEGQFERWAEQTEPGFKFAVTLARRVTSFGRVEGVDAAAQSIAKLYTGELANRVVNAAVQIHGGYGFMDEYAVSRLYRDQKVLEIGEGTNEIQRLVIARGLGF